MHALVPVTCGPAASGHTQPMPPHCDALDGPVVKAARAALEADDVDLVLPYVHDDGVTEVCDAFVAARAARHEGNAAHDVADRWCFETVVRIHRHGEGAPYTGLKPAGLDVGPVIPLAERAGLDGHPEALAAFLTQELRTQIESRVQHIGELAASREKSLQHEREYVEALLGLQVYSHHLYQRIRETSGH